jgi:anaerobic magnesium-protoporphyrin IX monomethyl ester cyclase
MRILLASSFFLRNDPKQFARMRPYPPLATLLVAASLRERGHDLHLFDATLAEGSHEFLTMLRNVRPQVVGILEDNFNYLTKMCTVRSRTATLEMVAAARAQGCRVAVNGSDANDVPARYLDAGAHAILLREADHTFPALIEHWAARPDDALDALPGLALLGADGTLRRTPSAPGVTDLDALPLPAWDLIDVPRYRRAWTEAHGSFSWNMVSSRGCPYGCNWCAKPVFGRRYAQRSPECVAEEMRRLHDEVGPDHIWFADDIFGLTASWIERFAAAVNARGARTAFTIQCRADLLTGPVAAALASAGAVEVWLGVESGSQKILSAMDKGTTVEEVRVATRNLREHGVRACWFLQLGYPGEQWEDLVMTRDLVREAQPDDIGVSVAYPLPGTLFHDRVRAELGPQRNWDYTGELAMLFRGTYSTEFYGRVRDLLHREVRTGRVDDLAWTRLSHEEPLDAAEAPYVAEAGRP